MRILLAEAPGQSIQSAVLVYEAYLRLVGKAPPDWQNRTHFFGFAVHLVREILVDRARRRRLPNVAAG